MFEFTGKRIGPARSPYVLADERPGGAGPARDRGGSQPHRGAVFPGGSPRAWRRIPGGALPFERSPGGGRRLAELFIFFPGGSPRAWRRIPGGSGLPWKLRPDGGEVPPRELAALSSGEEDGSVRADHLTMGCLMASLDEAFSLVVWRNQAQSMSIWMTLDWVLLAWESMAAPACTSMV